MAIGKEKWREEGREGEREGGREGGKEATHLSFANRKHEVVPLSLVRERE
jgi:hypothetical protein